MGTVVTATRLYDLLLPKIGSEAAECLTDYIDNKTRKEMEHQLAGLATKEDLFSLKQDFFNLWEKGRGELEGRKEELRVEMGSLKNELCGGMSDLDEMFRGEMMNQKDELRGEMHGLKEGLQGEMANLKDELRGEMHGLKEGLQGEMANLKDELRGEMSDLKQELRGEMNELGKELRGEMSDLKEEVRKDIDTVRAEMQSFRVETEKSFRHQFWLIVVLFLPLYLTLAAAAFNILK